MNISSLTKACIFALASLSMVTTATADPSTSNNALIKFGSTDGVAEATGEDSVAIGGKAKSTEDGSIAIGKGASAEKASSVAIGKQAMTSESSVAIGKQAMTSEEGSIAIGPNAKTYQKKQVADLDGGGEVTVVFENKPKAGIAIGKDASVVSHGSVALGDGAQGGRFGNQQKNGIGIAIGTHAKAIGDKTDSVKLYSSAYGEVYDAGIAIGNNSVADAASGIVLGNSSTVEEGNTSAILIGNGSNITSEKLPFSSKRVKSPSSIGIGNEVSIIGNGSLAIGTKSSIGHSIKSSNTKPFGGNIYDRNSVALGLGASSKRIGSVAIGAYSDTRRRTLTDQIYKYEETFSHYDFEKDEMINETRVVETKSEQEAYHFDLNDSYTRTIVAPFSNTVLTFGDDFDNINKTLTSQKNNKLAVYGVVSVGGAYQRKLGGERIFGRQIINVADGTEDTDAVNLRQLKGLAEQLSGQSAAVKIHGDTGDYDLKADLIVEGGSKAEETDLTTGNIKVVAVAPEGEQKNGKLQIQLNKDIKGLDSITIVDGDKPIRLNTEGLSNGGKKITNVDAGVADSDAANVGQLNQLRSEIVTKIDSKKAGIKVKADIIDTEKIKDTDDFTSVVIGGGVKDKKKLVDNSVGVSVTKDENGAAQFDVKVAKDLDGMNSIAFGPQSAKGQPDNRVSISAEKGLDNGGHKITNVAAGTAPTDAVNVGQLDSRIASSEHRMRKYANAGTASAMAAANIPQAYVPGHSALGVGLGYSHGQSALAVGVSTINDKGDWIFKGSASVNSEGGVFGAGASYMW